MYGASRLTITENVMLISYPGASAHFLARTLGALAAAGVVVDMISQTPPYGDDLFFSFTASDEHLDSTLKALSSDGKTIPSPMVSGGYTKLKLFGEEMEQSAGVAARALEALRKAGIDVAMITTSDQEISLLVRSEDADIAADALRTAYAL